MVNKFIQKTGISRHKGALHRQLHIPMGHKIPESELRHIIKTKIGGHVDHIKVTKKLKKRAVLAETLRHLRHKKSLSY